MKNLFIDQDVTQRRKETYLHDVQADEKTDVVAKTKKTTNSINQQNCQPALVASAMTSYRRHQPDDRVDLPIMQIWQLCSSQIGYS